MITFIIFKDHPDKPFFGLQSEGTVNSRTGRGNRSHLTFLGIWIPTHQRGIVHCPTSQPVSKDLKTAQTPEYGPQMVEGRKGQASKAMSATQVTPRSDIGKEEESVFWARKTDDSMELK